MPSFSFLKGFKGAFKSLFPIPEYTGTSMLVTDVGDEICWRQFLDVSDAFGYFGHQHHLSLNIGVGHHLPKDVTKILILSPTF